jgi:hypothetical protein
MARDLDPRRLERLLLQLRRHGVTRYQSGDLAIELGSPPAAQPPTPERPRPDPKDRRSIDDYLKSRLQRPGGN